MAGRREAAAIFAARDDPMLSKAARASSGRSGRVRAMRTKTDKAFVVGGADIEPITAAEGRFAQQPQQGGSGLAATGPAQRAGHFHRDDPISVGPAAQRSFRMTRLSRLTHSPRFGDCRSHRAEVGRRRLVGAIAALEALCQRF